MFLRWGYVACTRARSETHLYLTAETHEREAHGHEPPDFDASERTARALTVPASEPLALEQARPPHDMTTRLLARQCERFDQQRARAGQRLVAAEQELKNLGWRGRRERALELRAEIAFQRDALRLAEERCATVKPPTAPEPATPAREALRPTRNRPLQRDRTTERAWERRGLGIELDR
jgi:hypothetical protein